MEAASSRFLRSSVRSTTSPSICSRAPINLTDCILSDGSDIKQNKTKPQTNKQKESTILSQGNVCSGLSSLARFCYSFVQGHSEPSHQVQGGGQHRYRPSVPRGRIHTQPDTLSSLHHDLSCQNKNKNKRKIWENMLHYSIACSSNLDAIT